MSLIFKDLNNKLKSLATKTELNVEQDKIVELYDLSLFIGQSYFANDGGENYLAHYMAMAMYVVLVYFHYF